jgi:hypothetical protein
MKTQQAALRLNICSKLLREIKASRNLTTKFGNAFYRAVLKEGGPFRFDVGNPDGPLRSGFPFFQFATVFHSSPIVGLHGSAGP